MRLIVLQETNWTFVFPESPYESFRDSALVFFTYFTPVIVAIGLFGNIVSLIVFLSARIRKTSASVYLASLAIADTSVLVFYVVPDWVNRSLKIIFPNARYSFWDLDGICHVRLYLGYVSRLVASWVIVSFTYERFVGVCYPLQTLQRHPKRVLVIACVFYSILLMYVPFLSESHTYNGGVIKCSYKLEYRNMTFTLDSIFMCLSFVLPVVLITLLNVLIIRTLYIRNEVGMAFSKARTTPMVFTLILFAISFFYIVFHLPYCVAWIRLQTVINPFTFHFDLDFWNYWDAIMLIVKPIYFTNYCSNFFLYCITWSQFRSELKTNMCSQMCVKIIRVNNDQSSADQDRPLEHKCLPTTSSANTRQTECLKIN